MRAMAPKFEPFTNKGQNAARLDSGFPPSSPVIRCLTASVSGLNRICLCQHEGYKPRRKCS